MTYATPAHVRDRYPEQDLVQLTDPEALEIKEDRLVGALGDAAAEINSYVQGRYTLPLVDVPEHLRTIACDIAIYRLQVLRPQLSIEDARNRYEDARRWLEKVASGQVQLGLGSASQTPTVQSGGPEVVGPGRVFTRDSLRGL